MANLDRRQILGYRYQVNGLATRLPEGDLVKAARPGLQDSSPRSAVLSLHARVENIQQDAWRDRRLVQVWGPRGAIYLVPKEDLALFTLGLLPRNPDRVAHLEGLAKSVLRLLDGRPQLHSSVLGKVPEIGGQRELLWAAATGWLLPIWDASSTAVYPAEPAEADPEESRLALARRFIHHYGPITAKSLEWFTDASTGDATATLKALAPELATVQVGDEEALMLEEDVDAAAAAVPPTGLAFLPPEDVYISRLFSRLLMPDETRRALLYPRAPLPGAVVVDGEVVATWRRRDRRFTFTSLPGFQSAALVAPLTEAARSLPLPGEPDNTIVDWEDD